MIPQGSTVFRCGSMSAVGMGLWEAIAALPGVNLIDPYRPELSREEGLELRRQGLTADIMVASWREKTAMSFVVIFFLVFEKIDVLFLRSFSGVMSWRSRSANIRKPSIYCNGRSSSNRPC